MKTYIFYCLVFVINIVLISCKDDNDKIIPQKTEQSSCLLMSKLDFSGSSNWYAYNGSNKLVLDSNSFQTIKYYYNPQDKIDFSLTVFSSGTLYLTDYRYEGATLKQSISFYLVNNDTNIMEYQDYELDGQNRVISITRTKPWGSITRPIGKFSFKYNSNGDIEEKVIYTYNGATFIPNTKEVYEYSQSNSEPTLNFILFNNILLTGNKKLISKTNYYNYITSQNSFEDTPSNERTVEIRLDEERRPTLFLFSLNWGTLNYKCN